METLSTLIESNTRFTLDDFTAREGTVREVSIQWQAEYTLTGEQQTGRGAGPASDDAARHANEEKALQAARQDQALFQQSIPEYLARLADLLRDKAKPQVAWSEIVPLQQHACEYRCSACGGDGQTTCSKCSGNGRNDCNHCSGTGNCQNCSGTGRCQMCFGSGQQQCFHAGSNINTCQMCFASGMQNCGVCFGSGNCGVCHGSENCGVCDGSGQLDCYACQGGRVSCGNCVGTGRTHEICWFQPDLKISWSKPDLSGLTPSEAELIQRHIPDERLLDEAARIEVLDTATTAATLTARFRIWLPLKIISLSRKASATAGQESSEDYSVTLIGRNQSIDAPTGLLEWVEDSDLRLLEKELAENGGLTLGTGLLDAARCFLEGENNASITRALLQGDSAEKHGTPDYQARVKKALTSLVRKVRIKIMILPFLLLGPAAFMLFLYGADFLGLARLPLWQVWLLGLALLGTLWLVFLWRLSRQVQRLTSAPDPSLAKLVFKPTRTQWAGRLALVATIAGGSWFYLQHPLAERKAEAEVASKALSKEALAARVDELKLTLTTTDDALNAYQQGNHAAAWSMLKFHAEQKHDPRAQAYLGMMLLLGHGVSVDHAQAYSLLKQFDAKGEPMGAYGHGYLHLARLIPGANSRQGFALVRSAADRGIRDAMYATGIAFQKGQGTGKDAKKAFIYLKNAADRGHPEALQEVATLYKRGTGVKRSETAHREYLQRARRAKGETPTVPL